MKRSNRIWLMGICALASLLGAVHCFHAKPILAQQNTQHYDDGTFYISASVDVDNSYNLYVDSYMAVDYDYYEDIDSIAVEGYADQDGTPIGGGDDYGDDDDPANVPLQSNGPVPPGHEYGMGSDGYVCYDDGEGEGDCYDYEYVGSAYASINVAIPAPHINSLSTYSVTQGDTGTLTITGSNLVENFGDQLTINLGGSSAPFTSTGTPTSTTASFSYDFSWYPAGTYTLSVSNNEGASNTVSFIVLPATLPPPLSPCAVTSNPQAGYSAIVPSGAASGSGTMSVSFSGTAFAAISPTVTYGPYSTPSSIAASIAALITKNYFQYGLSAKAYGPNVVYSGNTTLGAVSNVVTGSGGATPSFATTTSTEAAGAAETACDEASIPPAPATEVTIVAWINKNAISLPLGESFALQAAFPPNGIGGNNESGSVLAGEYVLCNAQLSALALGNLGAVSNTASDKAYASAWLLKFSGNDDPGISITPSIFQNQPNKFRFFNDYAPGLGIHNTVVGDTLDPCGSGAGFIGEANPNNGQIGTSLFGDQYQMAEVRVDAAGRRGWKALNNQREIPWVWSVIEFDQNGYPDYGRIQNASPISPTTNYQIFPTYSVYINGSLIYKTVQGTPTAFASLPPGSQLSPGIIQ